MLSGVIKQFHEVIAKVPDVLLPQKFQAEAAQVVNTRNNGFTTRSFPFDKTFRNAPSKIFKTKKMMDN
jgi:hypothetical protein